MLTKTKITSLAVVMIALGSIAGFSQLSEDNHEIAQKRPTPTNMPLPPAIQLGNYGLVEEISKLDPSNYSVKTLVKSPGMNLGLDLLETRISHGGYITSFYAPDNVKHTSDTTLHEFTNAGGVVVIFSEIGENYDVDARISNYVEKMATVAPSMVAQDLSFTINGDPAIGILKDTEFNVPTKIHIYQSDGTLVTLLGGQSISELQKIAGALG